MHLQIYSTDKKIFDGSVTSIQLPGSLGLMGVLDRHAPIICGVLPGLLKINDVNKKQHFFVSSGFFECHKNNALLLSDAVEIPKDIDVNRAEESSNRAKSRLSQKKGINIIRAQNSLNRALARLSVAKKLS